MTALLLIAADAVAIALLCTFSYLRHRRRDLLVAFVGVNVGVLAVSVVLAGTEVALGLGLGLFGVLSIIRLRSSEISQRELAYYFAALALGLIAGLGTAAPLLPLGLMALIVAALYAVDHPALLPRARQATLTLDRAILDERELRAALEETLGAPVRTATVLSLDLVNDTTTVDVRYLASARVRTGAPAARRAEETEAVR